MFELEDHINRLTSRHIAKILSRLELDFNIQNDRLKDYVKDSIKAQFRFLQEDIIMKVREVESIRNSRRVHKNYTKEID